MATASIVVQIQPRLRPDSLLATALRICVDGDHPNRETPPMSPCPQCDSQNLYQAVDYVDSTTIGGELLPGLASNRFAPAQFAPGLPQLRLPTVFVASEALDKLTDTKDWVRV